MSLPRPCFSPRATCVKCTCPQNNIALNIATNNAVLATDRGKLNGLVVTVESVGKAVGPSLFAVLFAWSISEADSNPSGESSRGEGDPLAVPFGRNYRFVFCMFAVAMSALGVIGWRYLTHETLTFPLWQQEWNVDRSRTSNSMRRGAGNGLSPSNDFEKLETSQHSARSTAGDKPTLV